MSALDDIIAELNSDLGSPITKVQLLAALRDISAVATSTSLTLTEAVATTFVSPPDYIRTTGYYLPGDEGGAFYQKVTSFTTPVNALGKNVGGFTTADGTKYAMMLEHGDAFVNAFGAKSNEAHDFSNDQWQGFEDCKWWILSQPNVGAGSGNSSAGGVRMRIGRGYYHLLKTHSLEGAPYTIEGSGLASGGTVIRTPWNVSAFIMQHCYGGDTQTIGQEGYPFNGFATKVGFLVYVPGSPHLYKTTNTGTPNTGSPPTGTGTGILSGSATYDYVRERTWSEQLGGGAAFSTIRNLAIWGGWTGKTDPNGFDEDQTVMDGGYHSGIIMRTRGTVEDVYVLAYPGFGVAAVADGDPLLRGGGNCNAWLVRRSRLYSCGHAGLRVGLSDSNAGSSYDIDTAYNGQQGIADASFLGNVHVNPQHAFDGNRDLGSGKWYQGVTYGGYYWACRAQLIGADPAPNYANTPGTDKYSWIRAGGDGTATPLSTYPAWSSGNAALYAPCAAFMSNNTNSANTIVRLYVEGGTPPAQLGPQDLVCNVASGSAMEKTRQAVFLANGMWSRQLVVDNAFSFDGFAPKEQQIMFGGLNMDGGDPAQGPDNTIWGVNDWENLQYRLSLVGATARSHTGLDAAFKDLAQTNEIWGWTGSTSLKLFGRAAGNFVRGCFWATRIAIGDGGSFAGQFRVIQMGTGLGSGSTASTPNANGDFVLNYAPGSGSTDPWGWQARGGFWVPCNP